MTRRIAPTSTESYQLLAIEGKLGKQEQIVYDYLKTHGSKSNRDIHNGTGIEIGAVCGRIGKLKKMGLVKLDFEGRDPNTNRVVQKWGIKIGSPKQVELFESTHTWRTI